jgi:hypothetical protein
LWCGRPTENRTRRRLRLRCSIGLAMETNESVAANDSVSKPAVLVHPQASDCQNRE